MSTRQLVLLIKGQVKCKFYITRRNITNEITDCDKYTRYPFLAQETRQTVKNHLNNFKTVEVLWDPNFSKWIYNNFEKEA